MPRTIKRRRREAKTDYNLRLALLKSGKPRLVIRKTNHYLIAQIIETDIAQDKVLFGATSKDISKGKESKTLKNRESAYKLGLLLGGKAKAKVKEAILDIGMNRNIHKSRIYAVLKGVLDSGIHVPHDSKALPEIGSRKESTEIKKQTELKEKPKEIKIKPKEIKAK